MRWETKSLEDLTVDRPICYGVLKPGERQESGIPLIRVKDITSNEFDGSDVYRITHELSDEFSRSVLRGGEVLISVQGTVGRCAIVSEEMIGANISRTIAQIQPDKRVSRAFLRYFLLNMDGSHAITGSTRASLNISALRKYQVPIPPLEEQQRIVELLDEAFEAIDKAKANIERNLANARELFQSRLNDIFSNPSEDWEVKPLKYFCERVFAGGDKPESKDFSKVETTELSVPVVANSVKNRGIHGYTREARVTQSSVTVAARGSVGHVEYRDYPFFPIVRLIVLIPKRELIDVEFLMFALKSLKINSSGSSIPQLTVPMIKEYLIASSSLNEQRMIVRLLKELDNMTKDLILSYMQKLELLEELRQSILEKAFEGKLTEQS